MSYLPFKPDDVYIESRAQKYSATKRILSNLPDYKPIIVEDISNIDQSHQNKSLIIAKQKGNFLKRCPGTKNYICCGYKILNLINNCEIKCTYCILQGYFSYLYTIIYVNIDNLRLFIVK